MESKVVSLDIIPGHPKFLRLPSLSRSLIHSILPKACQEMHLHPKVFSIVKKPLTVTGAPVLTPRKKQRKKIINENFLKKPENIRPCTSSYTYRKVFEIKPRPVPVLRPYYSPRFLKSERKNSLKTFYCEISTPKPKPRGKKKFPVSMNTTQILFMKGEDLNNLQYIPEVQSNMESSEYTIESMNNYQDY